MSDKIVYICAKCGPFQELFVDEGSPDVIECPRCGNLAFITGLSKNGYNNLDYSEKENLYKPIAEECKNHTPEELKELLKAKKISAPVKKEKQKAEALAKILISSGFNFDGYKIVKYSGYISGDDACEIPRGGIFGGNNGQNLTDALVKIRRQALKELKEAAYDLGCNAVIGVDFDYITLEPETVNIAGGTRYEPYVICVTANGNAVIVEKE